MKRLQFSAVSLLLVCSLSCSNNPPATSGTGGNNSGSGGAVGSGGTSSGSGGSTSGSGGSTSGSGGSTDSGGTTGSGGSTSGSGGSANSGGSTGSGGATGSGGNGTGGGTATGGSAGGTTGSGGVPATGGTTGGGGSSGDFSALDGVLLTFPCANGSPNFDCPNVNCTGSPATSTVTSQYKMGGTSGTVYNVTVHFRGVVEAYNYQGGTRDSGTASISTNKNLFLRGGTLAASGNGNDYNTYELDVAPAVTGEANVYYLNSVIASENPHTSSTTQHLTFPIDYSATFKVQGQGTVTFKSYDSNCRLVQNCGAKASSNACSAPVSVSLAGSTPAAPATFMQPYQYPTGAHGQWVFFDVTGVTAAP